MIKPTDGLKRGCLIGLAIICTGLFVPWLLPCGVVWGCGVVTLAVYRSIRDSESYLDRLDPGLEHGARAYMDGRWDTGAYYAYLDGYYREKCRRERKVNDDPLDRAWREFEKALEQRKRPRRWGAPSAA